MTYITAQFIEKPIPLPSSLNCLVYHILTFNMPTHTYTYISLSFPEFLFP